MNTLPNARYERKLVVHRWAVPELLGMIRQHPAGFRTAYPERVVNNIYLDSPGLADYHDHVNGATQRVKTRVRWYGAACGLVQTPALERKIKCGTVSGKVSQSLPAIELNGHLALQSLESALKAAALPEGLRFAVAPLAPSLFNRYRRHYYVSADGRFRLTLDAELESARLRRGNSTATRLLDYAGMLILELKYRPADAEYAAAITNYFPFRIVRCSKYILGIERSLGL